jgi:hypothetical protein
MADNDPIPEAVERIRLRGRVRDKNVKRVLWAIVIAATALSALDIVDYRRQLSATHPGFTSGHVHRVTRYRRHAALDFIAWEILIVGVAVGACLIVTRRRD